MTTWKKYKRKIIDAIKKSENRKKRGKFYKGRKHSRKWNKGKSSKRGK